EQEAPQLPLVAADRQGQAVGIEQQAASRISCRLRWRIFFIGTDTGQVSLLIFLYNEHLVPG
ncbi:hypothetical protein RDM67_09240, partial [Pseudomonas aeruginosa]